MGGRKFILDSGASECCAFQKVLSCLDRHFQSIGIDKYLGILLCKDEGIMHQSLASPSPCESGYYTCVLGTLQSKEKARSRQFTIFLRFKSSLS